MSRRLDASEREARILRELRSNAAVRVGDLATRFSVTTETIRRDLARLSGSGQLQRTYGGGALPPAGLEPVVADRAARRIAERIGIGRAAAKLVAANDVLMIDAGSTTALFAKQLADIPGLTIITNSFEVAMAGATAPGSRVIICPGDYSLAEGGVTGAETVAFIARFRASCAFIGASGITPDGPSEANSEAASVKRAMLRVVARRVLLVDAEKFGRCALEQIVPWSLIDDVVCDLPPQGALAAAIASVETRLHLPGGSGASCAETVIT